MDVKRISSMLAVAAAALMIGGTALAQTPAAGDTAKPTHKHRTARTAGAGVNYGALLGLPAETIDKLAGGFTADQKTKIAGILEKYKTDAAALKPTKGAPVDPTLAQKRRELVKSTVEAIGAVVTPEQKTKLTEAAQKASILKQLGFPVAAIIELNPTADQQTKGAAIVKDAQDQVQALAPADRKVKSKEIYKAAHDKIVELLTVDQKAIIEKYTAAEKKHKGKKATK